MTKILFLQFSILEESQNFTLKVFMVPELLSLNTSNLLTILICHFLTTQTLQILDWYQIITSPP